MAKPLITLITIESSRVTRADLYAPDSKTAPNVYRQPRLGEYGIADAIRAALALASGCAKTVFVASDEVWGQTLTIPVAAIAGLGEADLAGALAFEAEPLSGIPSFQAALGFRPVEPPRVDGLKDFNAIAVDATVRDEIQAAVSKSGGKLRGLLAFKDLPPVASFNSDKEWAERCAQELSRKPLTVPVIGPAPEKVSPVRYWIFGLIVEAAVLAVCFINYKQNAQTEIESQKRTAELRAPQKLMADLKKKNDLAETELKGLTEKNDAARKVIESVKKTVVFQRERVPAIMHSLSTERTNDVIITGMKSHDALKMDVEGMSLTPPAADKFATKLETLLAEKTLHAQSFSKASQNISKDGGPWKFTLQIVSEHNRGTYTQAATSAPPAGPVSEDE